MNDATQLPKDHTETFPQRVPIKVIGRDGVLDPAAIAAVISEKLGVQELTDWNSKKNGSYISYTFWITLPDKYAEEPLRHAIHTLPGVVMQL